MDGYDHSVHCGMFHSAASNSTYLTTHAARCGVVVDCHENCKELTVPYRSGKSSYGKSLRPSQSTTDQEMMSALPPRTRRLCLGHSPIEERAKIISRAAQLLLERKSELANSQPSKWASALQKAR